MADDDPANGRYASFREFADFREETRTELRSLSQRADVLEKEFKLEVASAIKTMTRQVEAMEQRQQVDREAAIAARRWRVSTVVQAYGPFFTGLIAIAIAVWSHVFP